MGTKNSQFERKRRRPTKVYQEKTCLAGRQVHRGGLSLLEPNCEICSHEGVSHRPPYRPNFGVFETMRTYGHDIFKLDKHLERLQKSASVIGMKLPKNLDEIRRQVLEKIDGSDIRIRLVVTPDEVVIETYPLEIDPAIYEGVHAVCINVEREKPEAKAFPYDKCVEAHNEAEKQGCYEAILVDRDGFVREGAYSNIFWINDGQIFTNDKNILQGVTRETVIELTDCKFAEITPEELRRADEVFLTKTTTGPVPIIEIDGVRIGDGKAGAGFYNLSQSCSKIDF